ncbi:poly polymerase and DNA-ligase Zn-finger region-domain-containing protein, partial [Lasiosphaeris hirsuta]
ELSANNRAGCKDKVCKESNVKILKGELRLGTWVEIKDHGSWQWRHWGCVSGSQVENLREKIGKDAKGEYRWDAIDGWEELDEKPELQEKIKRVVEQGHIDDEDFKGVSIPLFLPFRPHPTNLG